MIKFQNNCLFFSVHANLAGTLSGHASWVLSVAFSPDGKRFVSSSADRTVRVWDLDGMQCQNVFKEHNDQVPKIYSFNLLAFQFVNIMF